MTKLGALFIFAAALPLVLCPLALAEDNLLYNGDFEVVSTATPPPGWARWGDSTGQLPEDYSRDTNNPYEGDGCYRIHHRAGTSGFTVSHRNWAIQTAEGKAYTITFWARADQATTGIFYWDSYYSVNPYIDAAYSAGRWPIGSCLNLRQVVANSPPSQNDTTE